MKYNWQHPDWPNFVYEGAKCKTTVYQYAMDAGRLSAGVGQLNETLQYDIYIDLMACEAMNSSEIEGEHIEHDDVQATIKNTLGLNHPEVLIKNPRAAGISRLMVDVRRSFTEPLTTQRLLQWQEMVCSDLTDSQNNPLYPLGQWRQSVQPLRIVSTDNGIETVTFTAPEAQQIENEIEQFLTWYNRTNPMETPTEEDTLSGPVRAAIAHLWFETIHPFEAGNGRVGRAIAEQALAQDLGHPPMLSLSSQIKKNATAYYHQLHAATKPTMDITPWVVWFSQSILDAQKDEVKRADGMIQRATF